MTREEIIAHGLEQMKRIPTLPGYKTYTVAVKNEHFNPSLKSFSDDNNFSLFYFLRFRQVTVRSVVGLVTKEYQEWEFQEFVSTGEPALTSMVY